MNALRDLARQAVAKMDEARKAWHCVGGDDTLPGTTYREAAAACIALVRALPDGEEPRPSVIAALMEMRETIGNEYMDDSTRRHLTSSLDNLDTALSTPAQATRVGDARDAERPPMVGRMSDADFEADTITFHMQGDYYAAAGRYEIRYLGRADAAIDAATQHPAAVDGWISVEDRLPDFGSRVLVCSELIGAEPTTALLVECSYFRDGDDDEFTDDMERFTDDESMFLSLAAAGSRVLAWQPLPAALARAGGDK